MLFIINKFIYILFKYFILKTNLQIILQQLYIFNSYNILNFINKDNNILKISFFLNILYIYYYIKRIIIIKRIKELNIAIKKVRFIIFINNILL